jgi:hypothetical protein
MCVPILYDRQHCFSRTTPSGGVAQLFVWASLSCDRFLLIVVSFSFMRPIISSVSVFHKLFELDFPSNGTKNRGGVLEFVSPSHFVFLCMRMFCLRRSHSIFSHALFLCVRICYGFWEVIPSSLHPYFVIDSFSRSISPTHSPFLWPKIHLGFHEVIPYFLWDVLSNRPFSLTIFERKLCYAFSQRSHPIFSANAYSEMSMQM